MMYTICSLGNKLKEWNIGAVATSDAGDREGEAKAKLGKVGSEYEAKLFDVFLSRAWLSLIVLAICRKSIRKHDNPGWNTLLANLQWTTCTQSQEILDLSVGFRGHV
jgi:hypothetical protein